VRARFAYPCKSNAEYYNCKEETCSFLCILLVQEMGKSLQDEFILSWDDVEQFFSEFKGDNMPNILRLIRTIRQEGFEKTLRAGTSLIILKLSRAREYGLLEGRPHIYFLFHLDEPPMEVRFHRSDNEEECLVFDKTEYNETIAGILKELEQMKIT
jgi:hypothetical protein